MCITRMITDRIGPHSVLLPLLTNSKKRMFHNFTVLEITLSAVSVTNKICLTFSAQVVVAML